MLPKIPDQLAHTHMT